MGGEDARGGENVGLILARRGAELDDAREIVAAGDEADGAGPGDAGGVAVAGAGDGQTGEGPGEPDQPVAIDLQPEHLDAGGVVVA